jgi:hypothetical protein
VAFSVAAACYAPGVLNLKISPSLRGEWRVSQKILEDGTRVTARTRWVSDYAIDVDWIERISPLGIPVYRNQVFEFDGDTAELV